VKKENMVSYLASSGSFVYDPDFETSIAGIANTFSGIGSTGSVFCTLWYMGDSGSWVALAGKSVKLTRPDLTFVSVVSNASGVLDFANEIAQRGTYTFDYAGGAV